MGRLLAYSADRRRFGLGQTAHSMSVSPEGKRFTWAADPSAPDPIDVWVKSDDAPSLHVFVNGRAGSQSVDWLGPNNHYTFVMRSNGQPIMELDVDTTVTPLSSVVAFSQSAAPSAAPPAATPATSTPTAATPAGPSFFSQSTSLLGYSIPNTYLVGGGVLLAAILLKRKR